MKCKCSNCKYSSKINSANIMVCMGQKNMPRVNPNDKCEDWKLGDNIADKELIKEVATMSTNRLLESLDYCGHDSYYNDLYYAVREEIERRLKMMTLLRWNYEFYRDDYERDKYIEEYMNDSTFKHTGDY